MPSQSSQHSLFVVAALAFALQGLASPVVPLRRALPTPPSVSTSKTYLSALTVDDNPTNSPAYARDLFKTWDIISGTCDTRESEWYSNLDQKFVAEDVDSGPEEGRHKRCD